MKLNIFNLILKKSMDINGTYRGKQSYRIAILTFLSTIAIIASAAIIAKVILVSPNLAFWGDDAVSSSADRFIKKSETTQTKTAIRLEKSRRNLGPTFSTLTEAEKLKIKNLGPKSATPRPNAQPDARIDDQMERYVDEKLEDKSDDDLQQFSISGKVSDETGEAISGIGVVASVRRLFQTSEYGITAWIDPKQTTYTNHEGFYEFQQLADGEYEIRTQATDRYPTASIVVRTGVHSANIVLTEERDVWVYGIVTSTSGYPLEGVRVLPVGQKQVTFTDEMGNYRLSLALSGRHQSYMLRFILEGFREQGVKVANTDLRGLEEIQRNVSMEPTGVVAPVAGTVKGTDEVPVSGAGVQLISQHLERRYQAVSDHSGRFSFPEVEIAGDYRLWIRPKDSYKDYVKDGLNVTSDGLSLSIVLESLDFASLSGQMMNLEGKPVPGFSLWLQSAYATTQRSMLVTSDQQGYFFVEEVPLGKLSFQSHSSPYLAVSGIDLASDAEEEIQLTLDWGNHEIYGTVLNSEAEPVTGCLISLFWSHNQNGVKSHSTRKTVSDANGLFRFTNLGPGLHTLSVKADGFRNARFGHEVSGDNSKVLVKLQKVSGGAL